MLNKENISALHDARVHEMKIEFNFQEKISSNIDWCSKIFVIVIVCGVSSKILRYLFIKISILTNYNYPSENRNKS